MGLGDFNVAHLGVTHKQFGFTLLNLKLQSLIVPK